MIDFLWCPKCAAVTPCEEISKDNYKCNIGHEFKFNLQECISSYKVPQYWYEPVLKMHDYEIEFERKVQIRRAKERSAEAKAKWDGRSLRNKRYNFRHSTDI